MALTNRTPAEIRQSVQKHRENIALAEDAIRVSKDSISKWQALCPHENLEHTPRSTAEGDSWDTCLDCGKIIYD